MMKLIISIFLVLWASNCTLAQNDNTINVTPFEISITIADGEILLQGIEGTVWTDLTFKLEQGDVQVINETGMPPTGTCNQLNILEGTFCFTIKRNLNGIELISNHGTSWRKLSFSLGNYSTQKIDHHGMIIE